jgi:hypothetical protein
LDTKNVRIIFFCMIHYDRVKKKRPIFLNFAEIRRIRTGPNSKFGKFWNSNSKILKNKKIMKKTRSNSKNIGEEIFSNLDRLLS